MRIKDWLFFPLIILVAGIMIYIALFWGDGPKKGDPEDGWVIQGSDLNGLTKSPGTSLKMNGVDAAIMTADFTVDQTRSQGIFTTLAGDYALNYGGRELELIVRARAANENPAKKFQIAFLTVPAIKGRFGWRTFDLTNEYQDYKIKTKLAPFEVDDPVIYFGVWPDAEGKGGHMEVTRYSVKPID